MSNMTYYCAECVVNWWPYQATDGCCPRCGGGTSRQQEPASSNVDELFATLTRERTARERSALNHRLFDDYYRTKWAPRHPGTVDALECQLDLPSAPDPGERREAA